MAWKAVAVITLRVLALVACAIVMTRLLRDDAGLVGLSDSGAGVEPLWVSIGLMIGLFTVVLAALRPVQDNWVVCMAELVIAGGLVVAAWLIGDESEMASRAVPLLASVWLAVAAVDLARTIRHT